MKFKEKALIDLNSVIYSNKSKLSKKDKETLIVLREVIRRSKKPKTLWKQIKQLLKIIGIHLPNDDEGE